MTKKFIGQSPRHHVEDKTLVNGKSSFIHGISNITRVTFDLQHLNDIIPIPYAFEDNGGSFTDESIDARDTGDNDVNLLPAVPAVNDAFYFGAYEQFKKISIIDGTDGVGTWTIVWEYWNGNSWTALTVASYTGTVYDFTNVSDEIYWSSPSDWQKYVVNGVFAYWVRARVSVYSAITTRPQAKSITLELDGKQKWAGAEELLEEFTLYGDVITGTNIPRKNDVLLTQYKVNGNGAVGTVLAGFDTPFDGEITRVELSFATNGVTGTNTIDVNVGGTTIFTTQNNRPSLAHDAIDGLMSIARTIEAGTFSQGDRITIDIDAVATGTAPTDPIVSVYGRYKPYYQSPGEITRVVTSAATVGIDDVTSLQYCRIYDASAATFIDEDSTAKNSTDNDVELFVSPPTAGDMVYYGCTIPFNEITHADGTNAVALVATIVWQYYDGSNWQTLSTSAVSNDFSNISDPIYFDMPADWEVSTINGVSAFWIRANMTAFTSVTTEPQAKSIQLGISAVLDINVAGTTIYTVQTGRPVLHNSTNVDIGEINNGIKDAQGLPSSAGIVDGNFTRNQLISTDVDYACPSTGTEPVDLKVQVYGAYNNNGRNETFTWQSNDKKLSFWSDNLKSNTKVRVIVEGY